MKTLRIETARDGCISRGSHVPDIVFLGSLSSIESDLKKCARSCRSSPARKRIVPVIPGTQRRNHTGLNRRLECSSQRLETEVFSFIRYDVVRVTGIEPVTLALGVPCSILLSYTRSQPECSRRRPRSSTQARLTGWAGPAPDRAPLHSE